MDRNEMFGDLLERMASRGPHGTFPATPPIDKLLAAFNRPKLLSLKPGAVVRCVKLGNDFSGKQEDKPVLFVRYLTEAERTIVNIPKETGMPFRDFDMLIAVAIDPQDGELLKYAVDSTFYEVV